MSAITTGQPHCDRRPATDRLSQQGIDFMSWTPVARILRASARVVGLSCARSSLVEASWRWARSVSIARTPTSRGCRQRDAAHVGYVTADRRDGCRNAGCRGQKALSAGFRLAINRGTGMRGRRSVRRPRPRARARDGREGGPTSSERVRRYGPGTPRSSRCAL